MNNGSRTGPTRTLLNLTHENTVPAAVRAIVAPVLVDIACPPTDMDSIRGRLGVTLRGEDIGGAGQLRRFGTTYEIVYSTGQPLERRRFTIAHELAHLILIQTIKRASRSTKEIERLCDLIAVELLMPEPQFRTALPKQWTIPALFALARSFQTSLTATASRCADLTGITVLEANHGRINWSQGPLRNTIALKDEGLLQEVNAACTGRTGSAQLYLNDGQAVRRWTAEYRPMGNTGRALVLLSRERPTITTGVSAATV